MASNFPFNPLLSITESLKNISDMNFCNTYNSPKNNVENALNQLESVNSDLVLSNNSLCNSQSPKQSFLHIKSKQIDSQNFSNDENQYLKQISFRKNDKKNHHIFKTPERFKMSYEQKQIDEDRKSRQQIKSHIMKTKSQIEQKIQNENNQISQLFKDNTISNLTQKFEYIQDDVKRKSVSIMLQQKSENESESKFNLLIPQDIPISPLKIKKRPNQKSCDLKQFYSQRIMSNNSTNIPRDNYQIRILDRIRSDKNFENKVEQIQEQFETPDKIRQFINNKTLKKSKNSRQDNFSKQSSSIEKDLILEIHKCLKEFKIVQDSSNNYLADVEVTKNQMIQILKQMKFLKNSYQNNNKNYFKSQQNDTSENFEKLINLMWDITKSSFDKTCIKNLTLFILAVYGIQLEKKVFDQEKIDRIQKSFLLFRKNKIFAESQLCNQQRKKRCTSQQLLNNFKEKVFKKATQLQQQGKLLNYNLQNLSHAEFLKLQQELKKQEIQRKTELLKQKEMKKCTFQPKTNFTNNNVSQKIQKSKKKLEINLKLNGKTEKIILNPNENPQKAINEIIKKHNLNHKKSQKLKKVLCNLIK